MYHNTPGIPLLLLLLRGCELQQHQLAKKLWIRKFLVLKYFPTHHSIFTRIAMYINGAISF